MELHARRKGRRAAAALGCLGLMGSIACATHTGTAIGEKSTPGDAIGGVAPTQGRDAAGVLGGGSASSPASGLIGSYLDSQAKAVQDAVPDANVERQEDRLLVRLPGDVLFEPGSAALRAGGYERLRSFAQTLNEYPETDVVVKGYTDSQGSESYNLKLSEDRADYVRSFLVSEGVPERRLKSIGFGPQFPVATNETPEGRQQNRRVEFELRPNQSLRDREARGTTR